jgi:hypothetical protein
MNSFGALFAVAGFVLCLSTGLAHHTQASISFVLWFAAGFGFLAATSLVSGLLLRAKFGMW